jgi:hypothetical protein
MHGTTVKIAQQIFKETVTLELYKASFSSSICTFFLPNNTPISKLKGLGYDLQEAGLPIKKSV